MRNVRFTRSDAHEDGDHVAGAANSIRTSAKPAKAAARRAEIIEAARDLYEEKGLSKTSIQDIADRVGVTRSLFYHYFKDKDELTLAVLDSLVAEYVEALTFWDAEREEGQIEDALSSVVKLLRVGLFENSPLHAALTSKENSALYLEFVNRVTHHIATHMIEHTVADYQKLHEVRIAHLYETFYVLVAGVIGYLRNHPDADDAVIADVIAQTLYLDRP